MQATHEHRSDSEIAALKEEIEELKHEVTVLKKVLRDKIARYEVSQVRKGRDINSILDL
ncbi:MAG: hypothetical protein ACRD32_05020 [Nitrososphaerales archaeon]